jgi:uncharacterized protein (TIGR03437 family)
MLKSRLGRAILAMVPSVVLLYAYATGPEPRHTAAPGDDKLACTTAGCHVGTALNGGGGNVKVTFANGQTYVPGVAQKFTIVVTDAVARVYGFQMTARLESDLANGQAGDFTPGPGQGVICEDGGLKTSLGCPKNAPVQFIEHIGDPFRTNTIQVTWTPPATAVGNIHIYVAANAANADNQNTGDHIYTADYVLTAEGAVGSGSPPAITNVSSASGFSATAGLASGTWLEIYGSDLAPATRQWLGRDFNGSNAPTALDGVGVTVNGVAAYVAYISPTQVNVQAPDDPTVGPGIQIQVSNGGVKSNVMTMSKAAIAPALLAPDSFKVNGKQYVVAQFADQVFVGPSGLIAGVPFRPAKPGDVITIYAIGCGPVTPATPAGTIASGATSLQNPPTFKVGGATATVQYAGLVSGLVGLYQFNIVVPNVAAGDVALTMDAGGVNANSGLVVTVGQ